MSLATFEFIPATQLTTWSTRETVREVFCKLSQAQHLNKGSGEGRGPEIAGGTFIDSQKTGGFRVVGSRSTPTTGTSGRTAHEPVENLNHHPLLNQSLTG